MFTNKSKVRLIDTPNSDMKVVNAARVSFKKEVSDIDERDIRLINYLAKHNHWTPFSHCRNTFSFDFDGMPADNYAMLKFFGITLSQTERASMVIAEVDGTLYVRHSLVGWVNILKRAYPLYVTSRSPNAEESPFYGYELAQIIYTLNKQYPHSFKALADNFYSSFMLLIDSHEGLDEYETVQLLDEEFIDITLYETVPIFVARQRFKHMVGTTYNEVSRRYVDDDVELFLPDEWRARAENKKQGSLDTPAELVFQDDKDYFKHTMEKSVDTYSSLLGYYKVCPEQARMVLPQSMMTEYYVTANLSSWERFIKQRTEETAQKEIRDLASKVKVIIDGY